MEGLDWLAQYTSYCAVDVTHDGTITNLVGNLEKHGLQRLKKGSQVAEFDELVFLHAMPLDQPISLPLITLNDGDFIRCEIIPLDNDTTRINIIDAENESQRQQQLQEKAAMLYDVLAQKESLISELNRLHGELEQKNEEVKKANELKANFISGMSHEFRTPLATVLGYTGMIEDAATDDETRASCATVKRAASHVMALIDNILDASRFEQSRIKLTLDSHSIGQLINQVNEFFVPLAREKKLEFICNNSIDDKQEYLVDAVRLRQVLINLISNAIKFTDSGFVRSDASIDDGRLLVVVSDSGGGVDEELADSLFQPFSRKKHDPRQGAGLGLSIVKYIAELMDGEIHYELVDGDGRPGSQFTFIAPLKRNDVGEHTRKANDEEDALPCLRGKSIAIVEDDEDVGALTAVLLSKTGAVTKVIDRGAQAIEYIADNTPEIVIIDYNLPDCNGAHVVRQIRSRGFEGKIIALSAAGVEVLATMDADRVLQKPFSKKQLYKVVSGYD